MRGLDDILINRIAPLCPLVYLKLRSLCRKYRNALPVPEFVMWMRYYCNPTCVPFFPDPLKREFLNALYPRLRNYPELELRDIPSVFRPDMTRVQIYLDLPRGLNCERDLGRLTDGQFVDFICKRYCRLRCCCDLIMNDTTIWTLSIHYGYRVLIFANFERVK